MYFGNLRAAYPITPSDTLGQPGDALYVGAAGNVTIFTKGTPSFPAQAVLFPAVPAGTTIPCAFTKVMATGTNIANPNLIAMVEG